MSVRASEPGKCCNLAQSRAPDCGLRLAQGSNRLRSTRSWHGEPDHGRPCSQVLRSARASSLPGSSQRRPHPRRTRPPGTWTFEQRQPRAPSAARAVRARQPPRGFSRARRVPRHRSCASAAGANGVAFRPARGTHDPRHLATAAGSPAADAVRTGPSRSAHCPIRRDVPREGPQRARRPQTDHRRERPCRRRDTRRRAPAHACPANTRGRLDAAGSLPHLRARSRAEPHEHRREQVVVRRLPPLRYRRGRDVGTPFECGCCREDIAADRPRP